MDLYVLTENEIKVDYEGQLQYVNDRVVACSKDYDKVKSIMEETIKGTLKRGYFHIIYSQSRYTTILHNGGTAYMHYSINCINKVC